MAKSNVAKFMDLHVEKVVLGLSVLLLIYSVSHWMVSSPREFVSAFPGAPATLRPEQIDAFLVEKAGKLKQDAQQKTVIPELLPRYKELLTDWASLIEKERHPNLVLLTNPALGEPLAVRVLPGGDLNPVGWRLQQFVEEIPAPRTPVVKSQIALVRIPAPRVKPTDKLVERAVDLISAYGVASFPYKELADKWGEKALDAAKVFLKAEVEVEETTADGKVLPPVPVDSLVKGTSKGTVLPPEIPDYTGKNSAAVAQAIHSWESDPVQRLVLMPELVSVYSAEQSAWQAGERVLPLPRSLLEAKARVPAGGVELPVGPPPPGRMDVPMPPRGDGGRMGGRMDMEFPRGKAGTPPAAGVRDIPPTKVGDVRAPAPRPAPSVAGAVAVPSVTMQKADGELYMWWQQAGLKPGSRYRYRVRLVMVSPLLGREDLSKEGHKDETTTKTVRTPWSEWSEPVMVERPVKYFVVNASRMSEGQGQARVAVFGFAMGKWVEQEYNVAPGDPIGKTERLKPINPDTNTPVEMPVDLTTGAVAVDVVGDSPAGQSLRAQPVAALVLLDDSGQLRTMAAVTLDPTSEAFREYERLRGTEKYHPTPGTPSTPGTPVKPAKPAKPVRTEK